MVDFSKKEIDFLLHTLSLLGETSKEVEVTSLVEKVTPKVTALGEYNLEIQITNGDLQNLNSTMEALNKLVDEYVNAAFSDVETFDRIKRKMIGHLEMLSTLKDTFITPTNFLEDVLKKQIRANIIDQIRTETSVGVTQAKESVEKDPRYINQRDRLQKLRVISDSVKTKYDFYSKVLQSLIQNVSTASKEQQASKATS